MSYFKIIAENIKDTQKLITELNNKVVRRVDSCIVSTDTSFDHACMVVIAGTKTQAELVQHIMWRHNEGLYCTVREISKDEYKKLR